MACFLLFSQLDKALVIWTETNISDSIERSNFSVEKYLTAKWGRWPSGKGTCPLSNDLKLNPIDTQH